MVLKRRCHLFKCLFRSLVLISFFIGIAIFFGFFQIVRATDGFHIIKKEKFKFTIPVVDTRDWNLRDYLNHQHISEALAKIQWDSLKESVAGGWQQFSKKVDEMTGEFDLDATSKKTKKQLEKLKKDIKKRYDHLAEQIKNGDINAESFQAKMKDLMAWIREQVAKIKE